MKKPDEGKLLKFLLFAFPCYWTCAALWIATVCWKTSLLHPDVIAVALVSVGIITAAVLLMKQCYWISPLMVVLGLYIALQEDQFVGDIFRLYGAYLILHYLVCGVYVYRRRKRG